MQIDCRRRCPSSCKDGVESRQVDQRGKNAAMRRCDLGIGDNLVSPRHFEHEFVHIEINQIQAEPAMKWRDQQTLT